MAGASESVGVSFGAGGSGLSLSSRDWFVVGGVLERLIGIVGRPFSFSLRRWSRENIAHRVLMEVSGIVRSSHGRVYGRYSYVSSDDKTVSVVKFRAPWTSPYYRIVIVAGETVKRGVRGPAFLTGFLLEYLVVDRSLHSRLDIIKPRYKRAARANGLVVVASYRVTPSDLVLESWDCMGAYGVVREYRSKYIVFIPPIIAWNFTRWISFDKQHVYEEEWCRSIGKIFTSRDQGIRG